MARLERKFRPSRSGLERHAADAFLGRLQEERHVRLAERIDGLHRVADAEQRPAVAALPARQQQCEQPLLRRRGVLVLVHQQVADAVVEGERKLGRRRLVAQCIAGCGSHRGVVEALALRE